MEEIVQRAVVLEWNRQKEDNYGLISTICDSNSVLCFLRLPFDNTQLTSLSLLDTTVALNVMKVYI